MGSVNEADHTFKSIEQTIENVKTLNLMWLLLTYKSTIK